ncbi:MAG TPA: hydroxysqualene dehydroxylase HpnE [Ramlibacter sp.]|nr:hydroxysqualene dehydroxylase HpnE [Ramlibacter sp.]
MRVAVVGAGWGGLAAAVQATRAGHAVTLFEAARTLGGRARTLEVALPDGATVQVDNGQHILIGAYTETLALMRQVGVAPGDVFHAMPLALKLPGGDGIALPAWPAPLDAAWGICTARGWGLRDKLSLLGAALRWRLAGFRCDPGLTVAALCAGLRPRVMQELVEPLCVAALNTPGSQASAQVFLRVLQDSLFAPPAGAWGASWLLLPRAPLGDVLPQAAGRWLASQGAAVRLGERVQALQRTTGGWHAHGAAGAGDAFDAVVLACPVTEGVRLVEGSGCAAPQWLASASAMRHEALATVYVTGAPRLPMPMLALRSGPGAPAQFVFDRGQLGGPSGLAAFVVSASHGDRESLEAQVMAQARALGWHGVAPLQTVVEKRATFACTPGLVRPGLQVAPGLWACGDYVDGPYPATLEGAVRSGLAAATALG